MEAKRELIDALVELQSASWSRSWKRVKAARLRVKGLLGVDIPGPLSHVMAEATTHREGQTACGCIALGLTCNCASWL